MKQYSLTRPKEYTLLNENKNLLILFVLNFEK